MRMRWRAAAAALPVLAGCGPDAAQPLEPAAAPVLDAMPESAGDTGGYYGSGHRYEPPPPPPPEEDLGA